MKPRFCYLLLICIPQLSFASDALQRVIESRVAAAAQARYPKAEIRINVPELPPFVRERPCETPVINIKGAHLLHRVAVGLRCDGTKPWSAYITVMVEASQAIPTICQPVPRGHRLRRADLCNHPEDLARLPPLTLTVLDGIIGLETKRALPRGATLQSTTLMPARLISRGDTIQLEAGLGSVRISTRARAHSDGRLGEQIPVENLRSGKRLRAWVVGPGRASTRPAPPDHATPSMAALTGAR